MAYHGTRKLSDSEVVASYEGSEDMDSLRQLPFIRGETPDEVTKHFNIFGDFFTTATIYLLMEMVDAIDGEALTKDYTRIYSDLYDGYTNMYRREAFQVSDTCSFLHLLHRVVVVTTLVSPHRRTQDISFPKLKKIQARCFINVRLSCCNG